MWICETSSWWLGTWFTPPLVFLLRHCFINTPHLTLPTFDILLVMNWTPLAVQLWKIFLTFGHMVHPSSCLPFETLIHWHLTLLTSNVLLAMVEHHQAAIVRDLFLDIWAHNAPPLEAFESLIHDTKPCWPPKLLNYLLNTLTSWARRPLKHAPNLLPCLHLHKSSSHEHPFSINLMI